ncbi:heavy-metal-associated domain-containing protein [Pseudodonghicola xiamenensis]|uniref:Heavy metal transport/detoxification protein n=1 Tax=Pseudodonghicola xiamenensis TaxID=337702 RepID=A0A8J3H9N9_9RHOB|nr:heavy-metal-associated domain-containing protein [Pseudodonghicola xiamenensis]GHG94211.1 heavy metal transport/detoxification protein [Pseudodonghicola xiamenensis]
MKFSVPEMSCGHCTASIEKAIKEADPAAEVTCDLPSRSVEVSSSLSAATIATTLDEIGFEAKPAA